MHIVGGSYYELCAEPHWSQLYGSGARAAAALMRRAGAVTLSTYIGPKERPLLEQLVATYGFTLQCSHAPDTFSFHYHHPLATPAIRPNPLEAERQPAVEVSDEVILRFGLLEGDAVVRGPHVTYDPQSAFNPEHFAANGSEAEHLAIVCNLPEAYKLTGADSPEKAAEALISDGAEVVVLKRGYAGALVATADEVEQIAAFRTPRVWPLGSGDVFAAVFAHEWGERRSTPTQAAHQASLATAFYCDTQTLPIPPANELPQHPPITAPSQAQKRPSVYLAGPFFTTAERWLINELRSQLIEHDVPVFSPFHDVGHGIARDVAPADIDGLRSSSVVLAALDGLDAGTLFEVGYARALGTPVVGFVQAEGEESMKMLEGTGCILCNDLATAVYQTLWATLDV